MTWKRITSSMVKFLVGDVQNSLKKIASRYDVTYPETCGHDREIVHWPLRAFSCCRASRAARTRGDNEARSTQDFMKSCYDMLAWFYIAFNNLGETHSKQIMGTSSLLRIHLKGEVEEVPEHRRQVLFLLDLRCTVGSDQPQGSEWRLC